MTIPKLEVLLTKKDIFYPQWWFACDVTESYVESKVKEYVESVNEQDVGERNLFPPIQNVATDLP